MTLRRLRVLLTRLPDGALTAAEWAHRGESARWSRSEQLLAGIVDVLQSGFWRNEAMWTEESGRRPHPDPIPRPGLELPDRRAAFLKRFAALRS